MQTFQGLGASESFINFAPSFLRSQDVMKLNPPQHEGPENERQALAQIRVRGH